MRSVPPEKMRIWLDKLQPQGVALDGAQCRKVLQLDSLVVKWNRAARLTGFRNDEERFDRYFGEALHASVWLPEKGKAVDVGSGGGSPALPMAIQRPGLGWTLLEPNQKKAVFLQEAAVALEMGNVSVVSSRFMDFQTAAPVQVVTTRGLALTRESIEAFGQWLAPHGQLFVFTGERAARKVVESSRGSWLLKARERLAPRFQAVLIVLERE